MTFRYQGESPRKALPGDMLLVVRKFQPTTSIVLRGDLAGLRCFPKDALHA